MDGISQYQRPGAIVVQEPRQPNPWADLMPNLLQTVIGGTVLAKIRNNLEQRRLEQERIQQERQLLTENLISGILQPAQATVTEEQTIRGTQQSPDYFDVREGVSRAMTPEEMQGVGIFNLAGQTVQRAQPKKPQIWQDEKSGAWLMQFGDTVKELTPEQQEQLQIADVGNGYKVAMFGKDMRLIPPQGALGSGAEGFTPRIVDLGGGVQVLQTGPRNFEQLRQGGGGGKATYKTVKDPNSPTGWSYRDMDTGEVTLNAPAPTSSWMGGMIPGLTVDDGLGEGDGDMIEGAPAVEQKPPSKIRRPMPKPEASLKPEASVPAGSKFAGLHKGTRKPVFEGPDGKLYMVA